MFAQVVLLFCVLTVAFAQSPVTARHYITVYANDNIYYGDRSQVVQFRNGFRPMCKSLDRDLMIDKLLYDRITIEHSGTYHIANGMVQGVGVEFQKLNEGHEDFRTIMILVFRDEQELNSLLTL